VSIDKIRVCWIDDCPDEGEPGPYLPEQYRPFFEINRRTSDEQNILSYVSIKDIQSDLHEFLIKEYETKHFPCEILALDYDLSKSKSAAVSSAGRTIGDNPKLPEMNFQTENTTKQGSAPESTLAFDGLLIGIFYATLARKHPTGVVPMSYRMKELSGTSVPAFQELTKPALGIDFNVIEKDKEDKKRSWRNILRFGAMHLRERIKDLYLSEDLIVSINDLMTLIENPEHETLSLKSVFVDHRCFPVRGLFIDYWECPAEEMHDAIRKFAMELLEARVTLDSLIKANKLSKTLWERYNEDSLMEKYFQLSKLCVKQVTNSEEFMELKALFGLNEAGDECLGKPVFDIRSEPNPADKASKYTREDRRWAAILLIRRFLKRVLVFMQTARVDTTIRGKQLKVYPSVEEDDILLLLFPMPRNPFPLPWHLEDAKERSNAKSTWTNWMKKNLSMQPSEILSGMALSPGECQVLQGLAMEEDIELGDTPSERLDAWRQFEASRLFMFGSRSG